MRKTICLVMALLAPFGVWIAGCRNDTQSARMPGGPETARLARAPGSSIGDAPGQPYIPARIDPEVMMSPEQSGQSRVQAMADREAAMYARHNDAGLYVLPHWGGPAEPQFRQEPHAGDNPGRIWSRPVSGGDSPDLTPLQFQPIGNDPVINQLMAMAPGAYPNLDPNMPLGDPTLIPGMYFGPDDLALLGTTRSRAKPAASRRDGEGLALPPALTSDSFGDTGITAIHPVESRVDTPILQSVQESPVEPAQRPAVIKLKPLGEEETVATAPSAPVAFAPEERERVDRQLDADLLALPGLPGLPVVETVDATSEKPAVSSPIALDFAGMMASSAWQEENETSEPLVVADKAAPAAPAAVFAEPPAAPATAVEAPSAPASASKDGVGGEPEAVELEDLRFSEIAPPPLPTKDMFANIQPADTREASGNASAAGDMPRAPRKQDQAADADGASWLDDVEVPSDAGAARRPDGSLQPLVPVDFSLYDWEMKTVPQKLKLNPVKGQPARTPEEARNQEPEAPPLVDMQ